MLGVYLCSLECTRTAHYTKTEKTAQQRKSLLDGTGLRECTPRHSRSPGLVAAYKAAPRLDFAERRRRRQRMSSPASHTHRRTPRQDSEGICFHTTSTLSQWCTMERRIGHNLSLPAPVRTSQSGTRCNRDGDSENTYRECKSHSCLDLPPTPPHTMASTRAGLWVAP